MTELQNGIYRIKTQAGEFAANLAVQVVDGAARGMRLTTKGRWQVGGKFASLTAVQADTLAVHGLHDNQTVAE